MGDEGILVSAEETQQPVRRDVFALILVIIIIVAVIGTYLVLQLTDRAPEPTTFAVQGPAVSLTVLPPDGEQGVNTRASDQ